MAATRARPSAGRPTRDAGAALERLFELATYLTDTADGELAKQGLSRARAEVLWRLGRLGPITQRRLSVELACTPRNVTGLVDALERAGYVTREPHPTDRRATLVTLTERGRTTATEMVTGYGRMAKDLFAGLGSEEVAAFGATLERLLERLRSQGTG